MSRGWDLEPRGWAGTVLNVGEAERVGGAFLPGRAGAGEKITPRAGI